MEIAPQIAADIVLSGRRFHWKFAQHRALLTAKVIEHQPFGGDLGNVAVGHEKLRVRTKTAVAVGVQEFGANDPILRVLCVFE